MTKINLIKKAPNLTNRARITLDEFKVWLAELVANKKGALPDLDDWKEIKEMLDKVSSKPYDDTAKPHDSGACIPLKVEYYDIATMVDDMFESFGFEPFEEEQFWKTRLIEDENDGQIRLQDDMQLDLYETENNKNLYSQEEDTFTG